MYRKSVTARLQDPIVRAFWLDTFASWNDRFRSEAIAPVQNKIGQFLSNPILRNILEQPKSQVNLRTVMDRGQILIVNLSHGRVGESASKLLGSFLISSLQLAAMSRADMPELARLDFFCYVDEFQNFATESFAVILSQARKYRLSLTLACQYLDQMDEQTLAAVFGNVGSLLSFQMGSRDAETIAEQLGPELNPVDLIRLPKYHAYLRLLDNGIPLPPFSMTTIPPRKPPQKRARCIRRNSHKGRGPTSHT